MSLLNEMFLQFTVKVPNDKIKLFSMLKTNISVIWEAFTKMEVKIYTLGKKFGGKKIWRIWRFLVKTAKLSSRQN